MKSLQSLHVFVKVVEKGGFAAAARELGVTRSSVQKLIVGLETELGVQLVRRSTRHTSATEAGSMLYHRCISMLEEFDDVLNAVVQLSEAPAGRICLTAPIAFGMVRLSDLLSRFAKVYPGISLEVTLTDRFVDLIDEGFDIAIRFSNPQFSTSLDTRKLADTKRVLCASPAYLDEHGVPSNLADLQTHRCLVFGPLQRSGTWRLQSTEGEQNVPVKPVMWVNNGGVLRAAARAGCGIALLPIFLVKEDINRGDLTVVLRNYYQEISIFALCTRHQHVSASVRLLLDFLIDSFSKNSTDMEL
jgi:DNA-binding transcriptional LysR family regulator